MQAITQQQATARGMTRIGSVALTPVVVAGLMRQEFDRLGPAEFSRRVLEDGPYWYLTKEAAVRLLKETQ